MGVWGCGGVGVWGVWGCDPVETQPNGRKYNHKITTGYGGACISLDMLCRKSMVQPAGFNTKAG